MTMLLNEFHEVIRTVDVGTSYENRTMSGYLVGLGFNDSW
jgi:hypothetical protein